MAAPSAIAGLPTPRRRRAAALALLAALLFPACGGSTYDRKDLADSVKRLCLEDYDLEVEARLIGKTLYVASVLDGLVGRDLGLQQETLKKLEGAMLNTTRVALSTNADLNFLAVKARDSRLGVTVTLIRYLPDIKSLIYMRISRTDFEDRLVLETENSLEPEPVESWHDVTMTEFASRLAASRLQRQFSSNPLVSAFLQVRRVTGSFRNHVMTLQLDKFENEPETNLLIEEILRTAAVETVSDVVTKYDLRDIVKKVAVRDDAGRELLSLDVAEMLQKPRPAEKGKDLS